MVFEWRNSLNIHSPTIVTFTSSYEIFIHLTANGEWFWKIVVSTSDPPWLAEMWYYPNPSQFKDKNENSKKLKWNKIKKFQNKMLLKIPTSPALCPSAYLPHTFNSTSNSATGFPFVRVIWYTHVTLCFFFGRVAKILEINTKSKGSAALPFRTGVGWIWEWSGLGGIV